MKINECTIGARVRLTCNIGGGNYPGCSYGLIPAGTTGTITAIDLDAKIEYGEPPLTVLIDGEPETLEEWGYHLEVGIDRKKVDFDVIVADFEVVA